MIDPGIRALVRVPGGEWRDVTDAVLTDLPRRFVSEDPMGLVADLAEAYAEALGMEWKVSTNGTP